MFDYLFTKIVRTETLDEINAIISALDEGKYDMSEIQTAEINVLSQTQKQLLLQKEMITTLTEDFETLKIRYDELIDACAEVLSKWNEEETTP